MLLAAMAADDLQRFADHGRRLRFARGQVLARAGESAAHAYFIESGVASVVKTDRTGRRTEIFLIGPDSFSGSPIVMADGRWPYDTSVPVDQMDAVAVEADRLRDWMAESSPLRAVLMRAVHLQTIQIAEAMVSAAWQPLNARLARWLLMYRDRMRSDRLDVTHAFMALMVGAQRTRITAGLHELESEGAIVASRGRVVVRDPAILAAIADGGYGVPERERARLTPAAAGG